MIYIRKKTNFASNPFDYLTFFIHKTDDVICISAPSTYCHFVYGKGYHLLINSKQTVDFITPRPETMTDGYFMSLEIKMVLVFLHE